MDNEIKKKRSYRHLIYALISVACPFVAFGIVSTYQDYAYAELLAPKCCPIDDADVNAGAMMGFVIVVQLIFAVGVGSLVGLIFAVMSLKSKPRVFSFGTVALLFNLIPVVGVVVIFLRGTL